MNAAKDDGRGDVNCRAKVSGGDCSVAIRDGRETDREHTRLGRFVRATTSIKSPRDFDGV